MEVNLLSLVGTEDVLYYILSNEGLAQLNAMDMLDECEAIGNVAKEHILAEPDSIKEIVELVIKNNWSIIEEIEAVLY